MRRRDADLETEFPGVPRFDTLDEGLAATHPDAVAVCAYTEHHAAMTLKALAAGAHVFCEKPLADTLEAAERIVAAAREAGKTLLIGYILRVHPSWTRFVEIGRTLGKPLVMRMNLNQQSAGSFWQVHKNLMQSTSPIVDCGVHYVDIMCQVTHARPVAVHAIGARLTDEIAPAMYNYGHLDITFDDGSVGWYEAAWGPMISETAHFVKDMMGPNGSVSIVSDESGGSTSQLCRPQYTHAHQCAAHPSRGSGRQRRVRQARRRHLDRGRAGPSGALRARAAAVPQRDPRRGRSDRPS